MLTVIPQKLVFTLTLTIPGNNSQKISDFRLKSPLVLAMVHVFSSIKLSKPVSIDETDHAGFHVSG
ncbi:unnamed protein product [Schistosoma curassoni]|uniref:Transposase n=1 Tax=Schistosoma curassoni TaxID=6186 RepID=A0A183KQT1_9TREM|nr:unnamed protein product [Schistosoma curassoni]